MRQQSRLASFALTGLVAGASVVFPVEAKAACSQWDMPAKMYIQQSNRTIVAVQLSPAEGGFAGKANYSYYSESRDEIREIYGVLDGAVDGSNVQFTIHWGDDAARDVRNATGVYTGTIGPQGRMTGSSHDAVHPESTATWWASEVLTCHAAAAPSAPARPPIALGRVKPVPSSPPPVALGRVQPVEGTDPAAPASICDAARSARARNSPAAPSLERQCAAQGPE